MAKRITTGVTFDCLCGARGVPLAWGGDDGEMRLYKHVHGVDWSGKANCGRGAACHGPSDMMTLMLASAGLLVQSPPAAGGGVGVLERNERDGQS